MIEGFRPMLFPNDPVDIDTLTDTYLMSNKLDGIRCLFIDGKMLSRKFKPIRNVALQRRFTHLKLLSTTTQMIFDGELYGPYNFPEIAGYVMSYNKWCPDNIEFHCFDVIDPKNRNETALERAKNYSSWMMSQPFAEPVWQYVVRGPEEIKNRYQQFLAQGFEGAILKQIDSTYKFGRITTKSGQGYKIKPIHTFDAIVKGIEQATMAKPDSQRTVDAFGKSKTSGRAEDRMAIEKAASFIVDYNGFESKVTLAMTDEEKEEVWKNQSEYIGRTIEFKGMLIGSKDRVRHPVFVRYKDDA